MPLNRRWSRITRIAGDSTGIGYLALVLALLAVAAIAAMNRMQLTTVHGTPDRQMTKSPQ